MKDAMTTKISDDLDSLPADFWEQEESALEDCLQCNEATDAEDMRHCDTCNKPVCGGCLRSGLCDECEFNEWAADRMKEATDIIADVQEAMKERREKKAIS